MANSSVRWILVDDSYPSIQYRGPWFESSDSLADAGVSGPIFQGSQHGVNETASFTFSFSGTDISAFGTSAVTRSDSNARIDPQWACVVDGASIAYNEPSQQPQNQYPLCRSTPMSDGPHNITVVVSSTGGIPFWFDFLTVRLSPSSREIPHPSVLYQFSDPAVQYVSGQWTKLPNNEGMLTQEVGSTIFLSFNGTKVTWYGRMVNGYPSGPSAGTYTIDGGAPVPFTIDGLLFDWTTRYQQIIFDTGDLPMGQHNLTVKYLGASTPLVLEYMVVQDGDLLFTGNAPLPPMLDERPNHPLSKGVIIGAVLGGLALLVLAGVIVFLLRKLRQRRRVKRLREIDEGSPHIPSSMPPQYMVEATPFMDDRTPTNSPPTTPTPTASAAFTDGILSRPLSHASTVMMMPGHRSLSSYTSDEKVRMSYLSSSPPTSRPTSSGLYDPSVAARYNPMPSSSNLGVPTDMRYGPGSSSSRSGSDEKVRMEYASAVPVNRPMTLVNANSENQSPVTLVHHEDSGIRMAPDPQDIPRVLDVPPSYTPQ